MERPTVFRKTGAEPLIRYGLPIGHSLLDFWRWSVSDLVSNATRGRFAEFIVGTAIGFDFARVRDEWAAYDLEAPNGLRIEVKSAGYVQSWHQRTLSKISFSIRPSNFWDAESGKAEAQPRRASDVYVFALLAHTDPGTIDPLNLDQWSFHVVTTELIAGYERSRHSITLPSLDRLAKERPDHAEGPIPWSALRRSILRHPPRGPVGAAPSLTPLRAET